MDVQPTSPRDAAALSEFLGRALRRCPGDRLLTDPYMRWKYWSNRPDWAGSRSFVATEKGAIVAHAAAWPVQVRVPGMTLPAAHLIDWASDTRYPGAGAWLLRQIGARVRLMIATGGSDAARRLLPILGFRPHGELYSFARPVRPFRQAWTRTDRGWRLAARLVRNTFWRLVPPLSIPRGWSASSISPENAPTEFWCRPSATMAVTARDPGLYRYLVSSPAARHALYGLRKDGELIGYFCLAFAPEVARVADVWLESTFVDDWCAGFRTAAVVAAREKNVCEVSAWATTRIARDALCRAGFRLRERCMLSVFGDTDMLRGRELHAQMIDSDASFLTADRAAAYLT